MSFFQHHFPDLPKGGPQSKPEEVKIPSYLVVIDGANLMKVVDDNPEIPEGKTDIGNGEHRIWNAVNYNPMTGQMK